MDNNLQFSIGETLSRAREAVQKTQENVAAEVYIKLLYIQYLEEDKFDLLPGPFYVRSYIIKLSSLYGIDSEPLCLAYQALSGYVPNSIKTSFVDEKKNDKTSLDLLSDNFRKDKYQEEYSAKKVQLSQLMTIIIIVICSVGLLFVLNFIIKFFEPKENNLSSESSPSKIEIAKQPPLSVPATKKDIKTTKGSAIEFFIIAPSIRQATIPDNNY